MNANRWPDKISARRDIQAMFAENLRSRGEGDLSFSLEDQLNQVRLCTRHNLNLDKWASCAGVSRDYAQSLTDYNAQFPPDI